MTPIVSSFLHLIKKIISIFRDKWLLITCENNEILTPDIYLSYEEAFGEMKKAYDDMPDDGADKRIHKEYANYQDTVTNIDWRIVYVPFA